MPLALAALFQDHAVLQRDQPLPIWGWAAPRTRLRVTLASRAGVTLSNAQGDFLVRLPPLPAGGPHALTVAAIDTGERVEVRDLFVGEVWLASGQSNMEWSLEKSRPLTDADIATANFPHIRFFKVAARAHLGPHRDVEGEWQISSPEAAPGFSAVAFACARRLHRELGVPVGMIVSAWGGTVIQSWLSRSALALNPDTRDWLARYEAEVWTEARWERLSKRGPDGRVINFAADPGNTAHARGWHLPDFNDAAWETIDLPRTWQSAGRAHTGVFWFRLAVDLPADWVGRALRLNLGAVDKQDITYVNGLEVGRIGSGFDEECWNIPRSYLVPASLVVARRIVVAVRAYSFVYDGGLIGPAATMDIRLAEDSSRCGVPLAGVWRFACEHNLGAVVERHVLGHGERNSPHILFDNMIRPLAACALRGALWYQGESHTDTLSLPYARMLRDLVLDWRREWGKPDLAFHVIQLPGFNAAQPHQPASTWARVREAQTEILGMPHTGLAVTIDLGEAHDIHPKDKIPVGERAAAGILASVHGRADVSTSPIFDRFTREGVALRCHFRNAGGGLSTTDGKAPRPVYIAGEDRVFHAAEAWIEGATLLARHPKVPRPLALRYAWADNPEGANLVGADGLSPASPFRSDRW